MVASSGVRGVEPPHHSGESQRGEDQASDESYHARLMDSLVALLLHSKHFLGQVAHWHWCYLHAMFLCLVNVN